MIDPDGEWAWAVGFAAYDGYKAYKAGKSKKQIAWAVASGFGPGRYMKGAKYASKVISRRASFRAAKRDAGIPTSAQFKKHKKIYDGSSEHRTVYGFGKGKYVVLHKNDKRGRGPHLRHIMVFFCKKVENCKNIEDFDVLGNLHGLKHLSLLDCGSIPSIDFIVIASRLGITDNSNNDFDIGL